MEEIKKTQTVSPTELMDKLDQEHQEFASHFQDYVLRRSHEVAKQYMKEYEGMEKPTADALGAASVLAHELAAMRAYTCQTAHVIESLLKRVELLEAKVNQ